MKIKSMIKVISLTLCLILCFSSIPTYATEDSEKMVEQYSADIAYGKIFVDGVNQTVINQNELDTEIEILVFIVREMHTFSNSYLLQKL